MEGKRTGKFVLPSIRERRRVTSPTTRDLLGAGFNVTYRAGSFAEEGAEAKVCLPQWIAKVGKVGYVQGNGQLVKLSGFCLSFQMNWREHTVGEPRLFWRRTLFLGAGVLAERQLTSQNPLKSDGSKRASCFQHKPEVAKNALREFI